MGILQIGIGTQSAEGIFGNFKKVVWSILWVKKMGVLMDKDVSVMNFEAVLKVIKLVREGG